MWPRMCMIYALAAKHEVPLDNTWPCSIFIGQLPPRKDYLLRQSVSQDSIIYLNSSSMKRPLYITVQLHQVLLSQASPYIKYLLHYCGGKTVSPHVD